MVDVEVRRDRIIIRYKGKKWDWILEPRYWRNTLIWSAFLILFPIVSYFVSPILLNTVITANLYAAIAIPLALMTLGTGRMNFGPNFFIGVGGYTAALLSIAYGWGPMKTLPFAVITTLISALLFSPLVIVARGLYYVLLTLLLPLVFMEITFIYTDIFKGDVGLAGIKTLVNMGAVKVNFLMAAFISMFLMLLYLWVVNKIIKSRYGLIMAAINDRESEVAEAEITQKPHTEERSSQQRRPIEQRDGFCEARERKRRAKAFSER